MRPNAFIVLISIATGFCQAQTTTPTTQPATTQPTTEQVEAISIFTAFVEASVAQDRGKLHEFILLPDDEERRRWVMQVIDTGEIPPAGTKVVSLTVEMDGPVAVGQITYELPDGSRETSSSGFLVQREGQWKVVVDFFEGGGLTQEEMEIVSEHLGQW